MLELRHAGTLAEELLDQLQHNLICRARHDHKRAWHHGIGIAQESHVAAMDLGIRSVLAMALAAAELLAMRHAAELADLPVLMLVHLSAVIPPDYEQTSVLALMLDPFLV